MADGELTEAAPLEFIVNGEALSARLYPRYNRTVLLAIDAYVDDVVEHPLITRWVATRSGVMPFATLHIDRPEPGTDGPTVLLASYVAVADAVDGNVLDEVLDGITFMTRRARRRIAEILAEIDEMADDVPADDPAPHTTATESTRRRTDDTDDDGANVVTHRSRTRAQADVLAELNALIGLDQVKREVAALAHAQTVGELRRAAGLTVYSPSPHLVFVGNPGTGKTTVARLVGELYASIGLLPSGHVVETDRAGLVAGYVGQTALKTRRVCEQALGGVLFIDEAYSLDGGDRDYGSEAVEALITFMENHRNEFAVVVAGYPDEMRRFVDSNPGLRSRFDLTIPFADFTSAQLLHMFCTLATTNDYELTDDALTRVRAVIDAWPRHRGFGNGREVRKLFSDVTRRHATLLAGDPSNHALHLIPAAAVPAPAKATLPPRQNHGYL